MSLPLLLHILALGVWFGCIATETVFEHTTGTVPGMEEAIARLHVKVDLWIETPAFTAVLATGAWLYSTTPVTPMFTAKIWIGVAAIAVNVICVWLVFARDRAYAARKRGHALQLDHWQHKAGGLQVLLIIVVLALAFGARA